MVNYRQKRDLSWHQSSYRRAQPEVLVSTPEDVDRAVEAGQRAFRSWSKTTYAERQKALLAFADALEAEKDNFTKLLVQEQGKPECLSSFDF